MGCGGSKEAPEGGGGSNGGSGRGGSGRGSGRSGTADGVPSTSATQQSKRDGEGMSSAMSDSAGDDSDAEDPAKDGAGESGGGSGGGETDTSDAHASTTEEHLRQSSTLSPLADSGSLASMELSSVAGSSRQESKKDKDKDKSKDKKGKDKKSDKGTPAVDPVALELAKLRDVVNGLSECAVVDPNGIVLHTMDGSEGGAPIQTYIKLKRAAEALGESLGDEGFATTHIQGENRLFSMHGMGNGNLLVYYSTHEHTLAPNDRVDTKKLDDAVAPMLSNLLRLMGGD